MKKILKIVLPVMCAALVMNACKKTQNNPVLKTSNATNTLSASATVIALDSSTRQATAVTFKWDSVNYNIKYSATYILQLDSASDNFAHPVAVSPGAGIYTYTYTDSMLNIVALKLVTATSGAIEARVVSYIQAGSDFYDTVYSNKVSLTVTPYIVYVAPSFSYLWVPGAYQNWSPSTAPQVGSSDGINYTGFVYITAANTPSLAFKLTTSNDWTHENIGSVNAALTTTGNVSTGPLSATGGNIILPQAGYYYLDFTGSDSSLTATLINSWTATGTAVGSTPVTLGSYDTVTNTWYQDNVPLSAGTLTFAGNEGTSGTLTLGQSGGANGLSTTSTTGVTVATAGTYDIKLVLTTLMYSDTLTKH